MENFKNLELSELSRGQKAAETRRKHKAAQEEKRRQQAERERALWDIITSDAATIEEKNKAISLLLKLQGVLY